MGHRCDENDNLCFHFAEGLMTKNADFGEWSPNLPFLVAISCPARALGAVLLTRLVTRPPGTYKPARICNVGRGLC